MHEHSLAALLATSSLSESESVPRPRNLHMYASKVHLRLKFENRQVESQAVHFGTLTSGQRRNSDRVHVLASLEPPETSYIKHLDNKTWLLQSKLNAYFTFSLLIFVLSHHHTVLLILRHKH